jgi:hypothetical protein
LILYVFKSNGSLLSGWPVSIASGSGGFTFGWMSPVLCDINGDGNIDVISISETGSFLGTGGSEIYAFDKNGKILTGFPIGLPKVTYAAATVADVDQNGTANLLAGDLSGQLFIWDLPFPYNKNNAPWPKFRHDNWNTGLYEFKPPALPKAFSLLEPPDTGVVESPRPAFKWGDAQNFDVDSLTYSLYYSTDNNFAEDSTIVVSGIKEPAHTLSSDLPENVNYYWKVKAIAGGGFERWSTQTWRFTIEVNATPQITSLPDTVAYEDSLYQCLILASDEDASDSLRFSFLIKPSWLAVSDTVGTLPIPDFPPGHREVWPTAASPASIDGQGVGLVLAGIPRAKDVGDTLVSVQVSDGRGGTIVQTYTLHVLHVNHPPTPPLLLTPQNADTVALTFPSQEITFTWSRSHEVDVMDSVRYSFRLRGGSLDSTVSTLKDTTLTLNFMARLAPNTSYKWHVGVTDGLVTVRSDTFVFHTSGTIVGVRDDRQTPTTFALHPNHPNPFNPSTVIAYDVPKQSRVLLKIYDLLGKEVASLVDQLQVAGRHFVVFEATRLPSGVYFCRLEANGFVATRRMLFLR